ncbi:hypothetical protein [Tenacibaculum sp. SG-28]|uniref:hypothetical protein n=1 Tax=Tenacibaculum sp. SG-28 TaxID=754426 RepID=UPI000CF4282C|nr:hypothetical protein [Tenacibaculum sp. SG-28]PQJ19674.1 hypothetical protein BSU00_11905 [Tenacibaculum sp. SG-28]
MDAIFDFFFKGNVFIKIAMFLWAILVMCAAGEEIESFSASEIFDRINQQEIVATNKMHDINNTSTIDRK